MSQEVHILINITSEDSTWSMFINNKFRLKLRFHNQIYWRGMYTYKVFNLSLTLLSIVQLNIYIFNHNLQAYIKHYILKQAYKNNSANMRSAERMLKYTIWFKIMKCKAFFCNRWVHLHEVDSFQYLQYKNSVHRFMPDVETNN